MNKDIEQFTDKGLMDGDTGSYFISSQTIAELDPLRAEILQDALLLAAKERNLELRQEQDLDKDGIVIHWSPKSELAVIEDIVAKMLEKPAGEYVCQKEDLDLHEGPFFEQLQKKYKELFTKISDDEHIDIFVREVKKYPNLMRINWSPRAGNDPRMFKTS